MTGVCHVCLRDVSGTQAYHAACARHLFGTATVPRLDLELAKLHTAALAMVGRTSLSGVQRKISVNLVADHRTLQVAAGAGRYILKPQSDVYPAVPENEHVTTRLAELVGIDVGRCGLIRLGDSLGFLAQRFDRLPDGTKLRQEDFCQLAELSPKDKYDASAERCVKLVRQFASEPPVEVLKLYRLLLFVWWSGNGDMHLKNFSLLVDPGGMVRLTPAYDLVCTRLLIPDDPLALPILGKRANLARQQWLEFAEYCDIPKKAARRVLDVQASVLTEARLLLERCLLPPDLKRQYRQLIEDRTQALLANG